MHVVTEFFIVDIWYRVIFCYPIPDFDCIDVAVRYSLDFVGIDYGAAVVFVVSCGSLSGLNLYHAMVVCADWILDLDCEFVL